MYKTRFSQWGFVKNNTEDEVKKLLSMKFQRDAKGKVTEFVRNGKVINLGTYLKRKGVTEYDLIDFETPADLPDYVRCRTPTPPLAPDYLQSPDLVRAQETVFGNMRKAFLHCRQFEVETNTNVDWTTTMHWGAWSSDLLLQANRCFEVKDSDQGGHFLMLAFKQLEQDLKRLTPQAIKELLLGLVRRDPGVMTALSKYLAAYSSTHFERNHPLRQTFTTLYEVQQKHGPSTLSDVVWGCIPTIADELEAIYGRRHPYVVRNWIDLAIVHNHSDAAQLTKLADLELSPLQRAAEARGNNDPDNVAENIILRYSMLQLHYAADPDSDATCRATTELWAKLKALRVVHQVRDQRDAYCYHCVVKCGPEDKQCRERYDTLIAAVESFVGVTVLPYFEEDMHMVEHMPDSSTSWESAMQFLGGGGSMGGRNPW